MKINCSCQGFNENCYRCFGRGYYDSFPTTRHKKKADLIMCSECGISFRKNKLRNHLSRVHHQHDGEDTFILPLKKRKCLKSNDLQFQAKTDQTGSTRCTFFNKNSVDKEDRIEIDKMATYKRFVSVVRTLSVEKRNELERLKQEYSGLSRLDFIWHYLLQSFSTMGRAAGWHGLIENKSNYNRVTYNVLADLTPADRETQVRQVCREAGIRMPVKKAQYILGCFDYVKRLGGLKATKAKLLAQHGREAKIRFLHTFPGIGPKYARNIMMDVYHEDFRDSIALDVRIKAISYALGLSFANYDAHESFYLNVARDAGINGWELDRLLFNFHSEVELRLGIRNFT